MDVERWRLDDGIRTFDCLNFVRILTGKMSKESSKQIETEVLTRSKAIIYRPGFTTSSFEYILEVCIGPKKKFILILFFCFVCRCLL